MKKKGLRWICLLACLVCTMIGQGQAVQAKDKPDLSGTVTFLKETDKNYQFQVEVRNKGEDFDGTVRLLFDGTNEDIGCAYDRKITIPAGGEKQYTVTVLYNDMMRVRTTGMLAFLDEKGHVLKTERFQNPLKGQVTGVSVGILSDHPDKLGWMDMRGERYFIRNSGYPISLMEVNKENLEKTLDKLYFLVIDQYDVSSLGNDTVKKIEKWVSAGGWLLIGTGERAEETLGAFSPNFTGVTCGEITAAGEENSAHTAEQTQTAFYDYYDSGIDLSAMAMAELIGQNASYESNIFPGWVTMQGKGSVLVSAFSFGEDEMKKAGSSLCSDIYDEAVCNSSGTNQYQTDSDWGYMGRDAFAAIDHRNTRVNFSWLKILIICYVIMVGPLVYLLLRKKKKSEWYWAAVPVLGIFFIGMVYLFGQNLRVHGTQTYSVSVQNVDGKDTQKLDTYYLAYHSGLKPWDISLTDGYTSAGSAFSDYYTSSSQKASADRYKYRVTAEDTTSVGMKPTSNFENAYFHAEGTGKGHGEIKTNSLVCTDTKKSGTITNETGYDMPYVLVFSENRAVVLSDVKAGQTVDLAKEKPFLEQTSSYLEDTFTMLQDYERGSNGKADKKDSDFIGALLVGACHTVGADTWNSDKISVIGVMPDFTKTVSSKCNERAYGCLYTYAKQEGKDA